MAPAKNKSAQTPKYRFMCTRGEDSCLLWEWDDADQWWSIPAGTCDCSECHGFLNQNKHAVALARALQSAKKS